SFIRARKMLVPDQDKAASWIDIGQVGEIESIDPSIVSLLDSADFIPVIAPIGAGENGETYNINADLVAVSVAEVLKPGKLVVLPNPAGLLDTQGQLLAGLAPPRTDEPFADGTVSGGMRPKISAALDAARNGVKSVHIIDGRVEHAV